jgi:hypothetical protein
MWKLSRGIKWENSRLVKRSLVGRLPIYYLHGIIPGTHSPFFHIMYFENASATHAEKKVKIVKLRPLSDE